MSTEQALRELLRTRDELTSTLASINADICDMLPTWELKAEYGYKLAAINQYRVANNTTFLDAKKVVMQHLFDKGFKV